MLFLFALASSPFANGQVLERSSRSRSMARGWPFACEANTTVRQVAEPLSRNGKVVVITGADGRLGTAFALGAALANTTVVLAGRSPTKLVRTVHETLLAVPGARLDTSVFDMSNLSDVRRGAAMLLTKHPIIDVLVHNAGGEMDGTTADGFNTMFQVMNIAPALLTKLCLPALQRAKGGRIINVGSAASFDPLWLAPGHKASDMLGYARGKPALLSTIGCAFRSTANLLAQPPLT